MGAGEATVTAKLELLPECAARGGVVRNDYNSARIASQRKLAVVSHGAPAYTAFNAALKEYSMFGLGTQELVIVLVIILVLFGGAKLPQMMKGLGEGMKEFRKATHDDDEITRDKTNKPLV